MRFASAARFVATALSLTLGAASQVRAQTLPTRWNEEALVVGQLAGTWGMGISTMGGEGIEAGVAVKGGGGRPAGNGLFHGVVLFTRREGEVTLSGAYASVGGMDRQLPIRRKFDVKKGQIIVLGLMYFQPQPGTREGYRILVFDNRDETLDYLRRTHADRLAGHDGAALVLAPGDYLPTEKLVELRTAIAEKQARQAKRSGQFWVAGSAGTLAEVKVTGDSVRVLRFLPPVSYHEPMLNSWDAQGTLTFSSATKRWRVVNGAVEVVPKP